MLFILITCHIAGMACEPLERFQTMEQCEAGISYLEKNVAAEEFGQHPAYCLVVDRGKKSNT